MIPNPGSAGEAGPRDPENDQWPALWTIGHSTRSLDAFVDVIQAHRIELVADVRRFPGSRRLPHFASEPLAAALDARGVAYEWIPALGGRRTVRASDPDAEVESAWRHPAFHAYALHTLGEEFAEGLVALLMAAGGLRTAVMCSELLWWRCHRRVIADVVLSLGIPVWHIRDERPPEPHRLAAPARLVGDRLTYAPVPDAAGDR